MKLNRILAAAAIAIASTGISQLNTPQPSPMATLNQKVGLTDVEVIYSRPGMKGRTVFGGIVPFGEIWRTGANSSTKVKFSDNVKLGGQAIPAGQYALYTIPGQDEWTVIVYKSLENWGAGGYDKSQDLARFTVKPIKLNDKVETFTMDFSNLETSGAHLDIKWENTMVSLPIVTETDAQIEKQIASVMAGPDANSYYGAARFYLEKNKELDKASEWIGKAIMARPDAFWMMQVQAKIFKARGMKKEALAAAEKSLAMAVANEGGDFGYKASNEALIKEIKAMK